MEGEGTGPTVPIRGPRRLPDKERKKRRKKRNRNREHLRRPLSPQDILFLLQYHPPWVRWIVINVFFTARPAFRAFPFCFRLTCRLSVRHRAVACQQNRKKIRRSLTLAHPPLPPTPLT
jgi:hypothetical protein